MKMLVFMFFLLPVILPAQSNDVNIDEVVEKIDQLYRSESSYAKMRMQIITPHWERTLEMRAWSEGMDKTMIRILSPAKEKGVGTLRIGNEMWNYLPKTNKVIKIPPSMMMSSWMGSDFNNDDLVSEFTWREDYNVTQTSIDTAKADRIYLKLTPKEGRPIVWGKLIVAVRRSDYLPVWEKYYDENDKLMRIMRFENIQTMGGRNIPSRMVLVPQTEEGKTIMEYVNVDFNAGVPSNIFTLRNLRTPEVE